MVMAGRRDEQPASAAAAADVFDIIVIGAGGAGMMAALFAAIKGARVLLLESTAYVGGTTAYSGGTTWVPNTHLAAAVGAKDSVGNARLYLRNVIGAHVNNAMLDAFLTAGPLAIRRLDDATDVHFRAFAAHPDYQSDVEGATTCGRALEPMPFDGRLLGERFALVRPPIPEFTVLGGMMVDRQDIGHLMKLTKSWRSFRYAIALFARHLRDRTAHPRGTRLVMGNALVARLLYSLQRRNVAIWTRSVVTALQPSGAGLRLTVKHDGQLRELRALRGVVLAGGGFNRHASMREQRLGSTAPYSPTAPGTTGTTLDLALALGARIGADGLEPVLWAPVSARTRADGSTAVFPHFIMDRGKPGTMVVNQAGRRFLNETLSYHLFGRAMRVAHQTSPCIPAYLIADQRAVSAYGLGMIRPGARDVSAFIADGYVVRAATLRELAAQLGIDPDALEDSADRIRRYAVAGVDPEFQRGTTLYERNLGDPAFAPNPTLGPLERAPYYAVRLFPGDIGASSGLVTDEHARVLDGAGEPMRGLYAVGNDMHSVMAGTYPGPGITLGPAAAFAYLAMEDAFPSAVANLSRDAHVATA